ncbi:MAG: hypothetical protein ACOYI2_03830 [Bacillota bacterium]
MSTNVKNRNRELTKEKYKYEFTQEIGTTADRNDQKQKKLKE